VFKPTQEQQSAIELSQTVRCIKLSAAAGAAKTSTCVLIAEQNPVQSLYLAFNKTMADEAKDRFPPWVEVRTTHSLAYKAFGRQYAHKLSRPAGEYQNVGWTGSEVARMLHIPSQMIRSTKENITASSIGCCVLATVARFEQSAEKTLGPQHVSLSPIPVKKTSRHDFPEKSIRKDVLECAKKLWERRVDLGSPVLISHDTYLKLYQLSKPDLSEYKMIYLDEYQDTNWCVHDIAMQQQHSGLVVVGDKFQNIYGWRGAVNLMDKLEWPESSLSKSFRFGQAVADLANEVLRENKTGAYRTSIVGFEDADTEVLAAQEWFAKDKGDIVTTRIYRTNAHLISDAIVDILAGNRVALQIDVKNFVRCLESGIALKNGEKSKVKHDVFLGFDSWKEFKEEAEYDPECNKLYNIIQGGEVYRILSTLRDYHPPKTYDVKYSTAHKMKGLEDDVVILAEDFPSPLDKSGNWVGLSQEEQNLLYVALTRAKKVLVKNNTIEEILNHWQETCENVGGLSINVRDVRVIAPGDFLETPLDKVVELEMAKIVGAVGLMSDLDHFIEGENLHPGDDHWENMAMEFQGLPF
jgi:UvrD-like helicase C-terminal domain/AAA domain